MIMVTVGGREFALTDHAVARYHERVRPSWSVAEAAIELVERMRAGVIYLCTPDWARSRSFDHDGDIADEFIGLDEEVLLPVRRRVIKTALARSRVGAQVRIVRGKREAA